MQKQIIILLLIALTFNFCKFDHKKIASEHLHTNSISKIEMHLSAFGVESDDFPSIDAYVNFANDSSRCTKSYYNPAYKDSVYYLSHEEIKKVLELLQNSDLKKLKNEYDIARTDQPTSTTTIFLDKQKFVIKDYGLIADYPLQDLYKIVYKF